jgi:hypothetical protein
LRANRNIGRRGISGSQPKQSDSCYEDTQRVD